MCSINETAIVVVLVAICVMLLLLNQHEPTITFDQQTHPPRDKTYNGASTGQGSWYIGGANSALQKIKDGLHSVKVSKHDATAVQRQLEGELFGKWKDSFTNMEAKGIRIRELPKFLDHMVGTYEGIDAKMRQKMNGILLTTEWSHKLFEFNIKDTETSGAHYGIVAFGKSADGQKVDCIYTLYKMEFEIAPEEQYITQDHSYLWGLINWQTTDLKIVERRLGMKTLNKLRNFLHYKAMNAFYKEGYIDSINYVDSIEEATDTVDEI